MRRANNLIPLIADPDNIRMAAWKAAKGKRYAREVLEWHRNMDKEVVILRDQILQGQVQAGDYRYFKVYEPKERKICASAFREQVMHHALMNICHPFFERSQIYDSYASRKHKGTYAALERAKDYTRKYPWFLKLDVRKYFESIDHQVLITQLFRLFKEEKLLGIFTQLIGSYAAGPHQGLPIGNLTSQYFANHYLSGLDHFIKEGLGISAYVRYMDDMVVWGADKATLQSAFQAITCYIEERLHCKLKPDVLNRTRLGVPFLGYRVFPHHIRLLQKSKVRYIRKIRRIEDRYHRGEWHEAACQRRCLPLLAFVSHAETQGFKKRVYSQVIGQSS